MNDSTALTQWVINKIEKEYKDDIALLIGIKGHSVNGEMPRFAKSIRKVKK